MEYLTGNISVVGETTIIDAPGLEHAVYIDYLFIQNVAAGNCTLVIQNDDDERHTIVLVPNQWFEWQCVQSGGEYRLSENAALKFTVSGTVNINYAIRYNIYTIPPTPFVPEDVTQAEADALIWFFDHTDGLNWNDNTGWKQDPIVANWATVEVANGAVEGFFPINNGQSVVGDITEFPIDDLFALGYFNANTTAVTGSIAGWTLPAMESIQMQNVNMDGGNMLGLEIPASMYEFDVQSSGLTGLIDLSNAVAMTLLYVRDCAFTQEQVDAYLQSVYENRLMFQPQGTPEIRIGGNNAEPSGTYQDSPTPSTGKEYMYKLVNDPDQEGFYPWMITIHEDGQGDVTYSGGGQQQ